MPALFGSALAVQLGSALAMLLGSALAEPRVCTREMLRPLISDITEGPGQMEANMRALLQNAPECGKCLLHCPKAKDSRKCMLGCAEAELADEVEAGTTDKEAESADDEDEDEAEAAVLKKQRRKSVEPDMAELKRELGDMKGGSLLENLQRVQKVAAASSGKMKDAVKAAQQQAQEAHAKATQEAAQYEATKEGDDTDDDDEENEYGGDVLLLNSTTFDSTLAREALLLVEFFAPWCDTCKKFKPSWIEAAAELRDHQPTVRFAAVDYSRNEGLVVPYGVEKLPTIKAFRFGRVQKFDAALTKQAVVKLAKQLATPVLRRFSSADKLRGYLRDAVNTKPTVVLFYTDGSDDDVLSVFAEYAERRRDDFRLAIATDAAVKARYTPAAEATIAVTQPHRFQSKYEDEVLLLTLPSVDVRSKGSISDLRSSISEFAERAAVPLVGQITAANKPHVYDGLRPLVLVFCAVDFSPDASAATQRTRSLVLEVAHGMRTAGSNMTFAIGSDVEFADVGQFGLTETREDFDTAVVILSARGGKYPMRDKKLSVANLREHVARFEAGELQPFLLSARKPKKNNAAVKVVVADTFDKLIRAASGALLFLWSPACGSCLKIEPAFAEAAQRLRGRATFGKMDVAANDVAEDFFVERPPGLFWVAHGVATSYEGGHTAADFVEFVEGRLAAAAGSTHNEL